MRRLLTLLILLVLSFATLAFVFEISGLENDVLGYESSLTRRMPAGGTAQQRAQAEQRARAAMQRNENAKMRRSDCDYGFTPCWRSKSATADCCRVMLRGE